MLRHARRYFSTAHTFVNKLYKETRDPRFRQALKPRISPPVAPWSLVSKDVETAAEASNELMECVFKHIHSENNDNNAAALLVLTAAQLARFNLLLPLQRVVKTFLTTSHATGFHFNLFLQALSANPTRSPEAADQITQVLTTMSSRQLKLSSVTYTALLKDRFVPLQLTRHLHRRMIQEGHIPTADQLERFLRVFAKNGAIHDAGAYWELIHATQREDEKMRADTLILNSHGKRLDAFEFLKEMTQMGGQPSVESGSQHMAGAENEPLRPYVANNATAALHVSAKDRSTTIDKLIRPFMSMTQAKPLYPGRSTRLTTPTTATYTILIRGLIHRGDTRRACIFFSKLCRSSLVLDNAALSAGLEALVRNGEPHAAFVTLEKYAWKPGMPNAVGLTAAQQAYQEVDSAVANVPGDATEPSEPPRPQAGRLPAHQRHIKVTTTTVNNFMRVLLSPRIRRPKSADNESPSSSPFFFFPTPSRGPPPRAKPKTPEDVKAQERHEAGLHPRPDLVFNLFTHLTTLYGPQCCPNSRTLQLLIKAGVLGMELDDTLVGKLREISKGTGMGIKALRTIGLGKLFSKLTPLPPFKNVPKSMQWVVELESETEAGKEAGSCVEDKRRDEALLRMLSLLGHPSHGGLRRYMSSTTQDGLSPVDFVRRVWISVCWAMGEEVSKMRGVGKNVLEDVQAPARALRMGPEDDAGDNGSLGFGMGLRFNPKPYAFEPVSSFVQKSTDPDFGDTPTSSQSQSSSSTSTSSSTPPLYPTLIPTPTTLHDYIMFLGTASRALEIPHSLAWARELDVKIQKETVAVALVFWSEVTIGSPLRGGTERKVTPAEKEDQADGQGPQAVVEDLEGDEYHALCGWLTEWVGKGNMPGWKMIRHWREVVRKMRHDD